MAKGSGLTLESSNCGRTADVPNLLFLLCIIVRSRKFMLPRPKQRQTERKTSMRGKADSLLGPAPWVLAVNYAYQ